MSRFRLVILSLVAVLVMGAAPAWADDDVELEEPETTEAEDGELGKGALFIANRLYNHFGLLPAGVLELDPEGIAAFVELDLGFGDFFKLQLYAAAGGKSGELLAAACPDDGSGCEFDWGELFKGLTLPEGSPKNLGQLISEAKQGHGRPDHAASLDKVDGERGAHGQGKKDR